MRAADLERCLSLPFGPSGSSARHFPNCPAVYVIYAQPDIVLYIGATVMLRKRCGEHARVFRDVPSVRVAWFPLPGELHANAERALIEAFCPPLNTLHAPKGGAKIYYNRKDVTQFIKSQRASREERPQEGE